MSHTTSHTNITCSHTQMSHGTVTYKAPMSHTMANASEMYECNTQAP